MTEVIFVLVVIYATYVIHTAITSERLNSPKQKPISPPSANSPPLVKDKKAALKEKEAPMTQQLKQPPSKPVKTAKGTVRHPTTGEVVKIPVNNYRMTKRWIKEALVEEGLLDKVYKVNELNDDLKVKINQALGQLQSMEKYN